jgi:CDP-diacylglycerol--glycerol-3-phosphate 3-phosphatidyltransferase
MKINLPTKITISRIAIASLLLIAIFVLYVVDQFSPFVGNREISLGGEAKMNVINIIIAFVFVIASFTDFLDGYIARRDGLVTDLGKFLDPLADKMLINGLMIFLALNFPSISNDAKFPFFCVILMTIRDLVVDGMRFMAAQKNVVVAANIFGKAKTVMQMVAIVAVLFNSWPFSYFDSNRMPYTRVSDILCYIATILSLLSGVIYLYQNRKLFGGKNNG